MNGGAALLEHVQDSWRFSDPDDIGIQVNKLHHMLPAFVHSLQKLKQLGQGIPTNALRTTTCLDAFINYRIPINYKHYCLNKHMAPLGVLWFVDPAIRVQTQVREIIYSD